MGQPEHWCRLARVARLAIIAAGCLTLAHCGSPFSIDPKLGVSSSPRVVEMGDPVPKGGGTYRLGKPYTVAGVTYVPQDDPNYRSEGLASYYGPEFHGRLTANGEVFDMESLSAAHPTLPIPSYVRVTNPRTTSRSSYASMIAGLMRPTASSTCRAKPRTSWASMTTGWLGSGWNMSGRRRLTDPMTGCCSQPCARRTGPGAIARDAGLDDDVPAAVNAGLPTSRCRSGRPFNLGEPQEVAAADVQAAPAPASSYPSPRQNCRRRIISPRNNRRACRTRRTIWVGAGSMAAYAPVSAGYQQTTGLNQRALY